MHRGASVSAPCRWEPFAGGDRRSVSAAPVFNLINKTSVPMTGKVEEAGTDEYGRRQYLMVMSDMIAQGVSTPGGAADRTLQRRYGMRRAPVRR